MNPRDLFTQGIDKLTQFLETGGITEWLWIIGTALFLIITLCLIMYYGVVKSSDFAKWATIAGTIFILAAVLLLFFISLEAQDYQPVFNLIQ